MTKRTFRTSRKGAPSSGPLEEGAPSSHPALKAAVDWYFNQTFGFGVLQGEQALPFYCDGCVKFLL